ncbi:MAG: SET domain-containing protein [Acidobacteria bacterium]|nr:SET domain-containing protein [Acidobacteriota bacterium]
MKKKKYVIKRSTTGLGLFALADLPPQTRIIEYIGKRISKEDADNRYIVYLNETHALDGKARANAARYINHSCEPNAAAYTTGKRVWIWSELAIKAGEEITLDYGPEYFDAYIQPVGCRCKKCV